MPDTLLIFDGNSLVHRAFHALPQDLVSKKGELTNAAYGFTMMLIRVIGDLRPTHMAAAFDTPKPTFRHERFDAYKANRPPSPDGLAHQFGRVLEVLEVFNVPVFRVDGLEADDLLGTLADQAVAKGLEVILVTSDTDALQLVGPKVRVLASRRGLTDTIMYDLKAVRERYGLEPAQLVDLRALRGDVSDNIPGVPGIGEKTAVSLLSAYGNIEGVLGNLDQLPPRQRELLEPHTDQVRLSWELAEIVRDAPVELDLSRCVARPPERERATALFRELDFRTLVDRLPAIEKTLGGTGARAAARQSSLFDAAPAAPPAPARGRIVYSVEELREVATTLHRSAEPVAIAMLPDRPEAMRCEVLGLALATARDGWTYVPLAGAPADGIRPLPRKDALEALRPLLEDPGAPKSSPAAKQTMVALARYGIQLAGVDFDSELAAYLVEASGRALTLRDLSWSRLGRELPSIKEVTGEGRSALALDAVPIDRMAAHVGQEAVALALLRPILERELAEQGLEELYREVELPLVAVLAAMEQAGVAIDVPYLQEFSRELYQRIQEVERGIFESVGHEFNIGSPQQLGAVLFDELKLPGAKRTSTGRASTAAEVLTALKGAHPAIDLILEHRELTKLKSTYLDALPLLVNPETGRIHTTFNQAVAATGRLSSQDPNLQNLPVRTELGRRVRRAFIAPEPGWKILAADYSQIELRIQAHLTQDSTLLEAFRAGEDIHAATAAEMQGVPIEQVTSDMRRLAKTANFAIMYGVSPFGFSEQTGLPQHDSAAFIRRYFERFSGVEAFQKRLIKEARATSSVTTLLGRRRVIPELQSSVYAVRAAGERMAVNAPVQGSASDIIKIAMVRLHDHMLVNGMRARMLLQVHDELLFEVPDEELDQLQAAAKEIMEGAMELSVPLVVDLKVAENWGAMY